MAKWSELQKEEIKVNTKGRTTPFLEAALFRARGIVYKEYINNFEKMLEVTKKRDKEYHQLKAKGFA